MKRPSDTVTQMSIGSELPEGVRFIGREPGATAAWPLQDAPTDSDLSSCVACGLCLPHCPTYRLTGEESASPRGRITAMRAVSDGVATVDDTFASFMDLCLVCRACEDVCPSHVPFGRMMERARVQVEPLRTRRARFVRWLGLDVVLPHPFVLRIASALQPIARPFMPRRVRAMTPRRTSPFARLPRETAPADGVEIRGTVAVLSGCVQDRWFHEVNRATIRVLARNGWRVTVPREQRCCGALGAHNGRLKTARKLARRNARAFAGVDHVIVNAAGCSAHMKEYGELVEGTAAPGPRPDGVPGGRGTVGDADSAARGRQDRLPRRVPRAPRSAHPRTAASRAPPDPRRRHRGDRERRPVLRRRRPLQRARARDVGPADAREGRGRQGHRGPGDRERQPRLQHADRRRSAPARRGRRGGPSRPAARPGVPGDRRIEADSVHGHAIRERGSTVRGDPDRRGHARHHVGTVRRYRHEDPATSASAGTVATCCGRA